MNQVWKIVLEVVAAIGGIGVIFTAVIAFSSKFIADRLQKKYDIRLNEELESYKAGLENKKYISKTKFDAEFQLYKNLSKCFFDAVKTISVMIPQGYAKAPADKDVKKKVQEEYYMAAFTAVIAAQDELNSNVAFIPERFFDSYEEIRKLCMLQLDEFEKRWDVGYLADQEVKETFSRDAYNRTGEINENFKRLNNEIREYLETLDVLE